MEDLNKENLSGKDTEQEIDLIELARKLWSGRKTILRWGAIGIIAGIVIGLSIPKEYTTVIKLAPEASQSGGSSGNLGALAAMAGISPAGTSGKDAVNPQLYPDIVSSIPFTLELFDVKVTNSDATVTKSVKDYVSNDLSAPWWSAVMSLPGKAIGGIRSLFSGSDSEAVKNRKPDSFRLTPEESGIVGALSGRVNVDVDGKT